MRNDQAKTEYMECPRCSEKRVRTEDVEYTFPFGAGDKAIDLTAKVPVRICEACEFEFLDQVAEQRQHDAACKHLGLLTPSEIRELRACCNMNRAEFAALTGLGEATIGRWESGAVFQSVANDRYLRLLQVPGNMERLKNARFVSPSGPKRFRCISAQTGREFRELDWQLRRYA